MNERENDIGEQNYKTLSLDIDYYQSFLDADDISEDKKRELIETLWQIVVSFVDLGFGIEATQLALSASAKAQIEDKTSLDQICEQFSKISGDKHLTEEAI